MLTDALQKVNESAPRDTNGNKQGVVLKYVIVPTGLGLVDDEKLHGGFVNRARVIEKYKSRCLAAPPLRWCFCPLFTRLQRESDVQRHGCSGCSVGLPFGGDSAERRQRRGISAAKLRAERSHSKEISRHRQPRNGSNDGCCSL